MYFIASQLGKNAKVAGLKIGLENSKIGKIVLNTAYKAVGLKYVFSKKMFKNNELKLSIKVRSKEF